MNKIDDIFLSNQTIYHFTKIQTAYEFILHTNKLRLSDRKTSNDPIENITYRPFIKSSYGYDDSKIANDETAAKANRFILSKIKNSKQLCFCKNNDDPELQRFMVLPTEYYGFLKPRMWDQYGDKYNGICLVFDKRKLKENNPEVYSSDIEYINYEEFYRNNTSIDLNSLYYKGLDKYCEDFFEKIKKDSFLKHKDYSGENEYRYISFSQIETFIEIGDSLKAIILSERNLSDFARNWFNEYAIKYDIKLFYINWSPTGVSIHSKKEHDEFMEYTSSLVKRLKK